MSESTEPIVGNRRRRKNDGLFDKELQILKETREVLKLESVEGNTYKDQLILLSERYEEVLDQTKLITKVSDRQQKRINKINVTLNSVNAEMESKNVELQETLDDLAVAKVGRRATTITGIVFVGLFLLTEALIEPRIEAYLHETKGMLHDHEFAVGLSLKAVLALMLRPIEKIVEKLLMNAEKRKKQKEVIAQEFD